MASKLCLIFSSFFTLVIVINILESVCHQNKRTNYMRTVYEIRPTQRTTARTDPIKSQKDYKKDQLKDFYYGKYDTNQTLKESERNIYQGKASSHLNNYLIRTAKELDLPELLLIAEYNLLDNLLADLDILRILFKTKNKTTRSDRMYLRNKIIDFINGKLIYDPMDKGKQTDPDHQTGKLKACIGKPFTLIKEIRF